MILEHPRGTLKRLQFFAWSRLVLATDLPTSTKLVALALGLHGKGTTGHDIYPGRELLARETGLSVRSISVHLKTLEDAGLILCVRRGSNNGRAALASEYCLTELVQPTAPVSSPDQVQFPTRTGAVSDKNRCSGLQPTSSVPPHRSPQSIVACRTAHEEEIRN